MKYIFMDSNLVLSPDAVQVDYSMRNLQRLIRNSGEKDTNNVKVIFTNVPIESTKDIQEYISFYKLDGRVSYLSQTSYEPVPEYHKGMDFDIVKFYVDKYPMTDYVVICVRDEKIPDSPVKNHVVLCYENVFSTHAAEDAVYLLNGTLNPAYVSESDYRNFLKDFSERLRLRRITEDDLEEFFQYHTPSELERYRTSDVLDWILEHHDMSSFVNLFKKYIAARCVVFETGDEIQESVPSFTGLEDDTYVSPTTYIVLSVVSGTESLKVKAVARDLSCMLSFKVYADINTGEIRSHFVRTGRRIDVGGLKNFIEENLIEDISEENPTEENPTEENLAEENPTEDNLAEL